MKTDELIEGLGRQLRPVRRLSPPWQRTAAWLACSVAYVAAVGTYTWIRRGTLGVETAGPYVLQQAALAVTGGVAAFAAFVSVVPGAPNRTRAAVGVPIVMLTAALLWGTLRDMQQFGSAGFGRETDWPCVVSMTLGGLALWGMAGVMLRRGAVLEPRATTALAGIAAVSLANIEACISRIHGFTATVIVWHGATAAVVVLALLVVGPGLLRRRRPFAS
jgi:hypothetical protein